MESLLADMKKDVQCSLCNDTLTEPKILPCFHTFCKPCIKRHAELIDEVDVFKCPRCKSQTSLPEPSSVEDLQPSLLHSRLLKGLALVEGEKVCSVSDSHSPASWYCFDCGRSMCKECEKNHSEFIKDHKVVRLADLKKEDIEFIITRENPCKSHPHHRLESFCEDCDAMICVKCWKDDHKDHETMTLDKFVSIKKDVLSHHLRVLEQVRLDDKERQQQENIAKAIKQQGEKAKHEVKENTKRVMEMLQENERELVRQIDEKINTAQTNLNVIYHIPAAKEYIKNVMERGLASDMINIQETQCSEKFIFNPIPLSSGVVFIPNQELAQQVNTGLGEIQTHSETDHTMSTPRQHVSTEVRTEVEFMAKVAGQLTAEDQVNGNVVSNSPLVMNMKLQDMRITGQIHMNKLYTENIIYGSDIAVNRDKSRIALIIRVSYMQTVLSSRSLPAISAARVYKTNGNMLLTYPGNDNELANPQGLAFLNATDLVIAEKGKHRIHIVNTITGALIKPFGVEFVNEEIFHPCGVHVSEDGDIIVCDRDSHRVHVFTRDGNYQYQFGLKSQEIFDPVYVIKHGRLFYVSDHYNHVIHVFEKRVGNKVPIRISTIGGEGSADGQLSKPWGLAIDNDHHLLVCDAGNNRVQKFTLDGRFVGKTLDEINNPVSMAVLNDGQILVTTSRSADVLLVGQNEE